MNNLTPCFDHKAQQEETMKLKRLSILAIGLLLMSDTSSANAGKKLLLETSQGQVEIAFLPELAPNHVDRIAELA